jgi:hypothetical protein
MNPQITEQDPEDLPSVHTAPDYIPTVPNPDCGARNCHGCVRPCVLKNPMAGL